MAQLPNISEQQRVIPQTTRSIVGYSPNSAGASLEGIGATAGKLVNDYEDKQSKLDTTYADAHLLQAQADVMNKLKDEQDYTKIRPTYEQEMTKVQNDAAAMIKNPAAKQAFMAQSSLHLAGSLSQINTIVDTKRKEYGQASSLQNFDSGIDSASNTTDPAMSKLLLDNANNIVDASVASGFYTPVQGYEMKKKGAEKYGESWLIKKPYEEQLKLLTPSLQTPNDNAPLSVRNNNPGNMRDAKGSFLKFATPEEGQQAMTNDLRVKISGKSSAMKANFGDNYQPTIANIIKTWAPATENDTGAYINTVSKESGIAPDVPLTEADIAKIQPAMVKVEGGAKGTGYFAKTSTPVDFIPYEKRMELAKRAEGAIKNDIELRDKDPMTYAQVHGLTPNQPLDFNNPEALQSQLQGRANAAVNLHQSYGAPLKVMTDNEAKAFSTKLEEMPTNGQLGYLKTLRDSSDPQIYQSALQQIRPDSPVTAMAGMYLGIDKKITTATHWFKPNETVTPEYVAQNLLEGESLLNPTKASKKENGVGKVFPMPSDGTPNQPGLRSEFNNYVGDSFRGQPQMADQAYQAYRAFYAAEASKKGDYSGTMDSDIAQKSAHAVIGTVVDSGNNKVIAPWGMDETTFNDIAKVHFDTLAKAFDMKNISFSDVSLENTGEPGKFRAVVGSGYLVDAGGKPFTLKIGH